MPSKKNGLRLWRKTGFMALPFFLIRLRHSQVRKMPKSRIVISLLLAAISLLQAQQRCVVFEFQPVGVDTSTVKVATMLLKNCLTDLKAFVIIEPPPATRCYTTEEALRNAREVNAEKAIIGSIAQIGKKIVISYRLIDVPGDSVEYSDRVSISAIEDLDIIVERMASAIKGRRPITATVEVGKITEIEERQPFRARSPFSSIMFTTGYAFPLEHDFRPHPGNKLFTIDASVTYETRDLLAQGLMGLRRGKHWFRSIYFDLLVHRVLSQYDISPYIGGGLGIHKLGFDGNEDDGPALTVSGGIILFRTYYFRVLAGLKGTAIFTDKFGAVIFPAFNFGLTSPAFGSEGAIQTPAGGCILGCLGAFFLTGIMVALTS